MKSRCVVPCVHTFLTTTGPGCISHWTEIRQNRDLCNPLAESLRFRRSAAFTIVTNASHSSLSTATRQTAGIYLPLELTRSARNFEGFYDVITRVEVIVVAVMSEQLGTHDIFRKDTWNPSQRNTASKRPKRLL